ncbi:MAG TPA: MATE family efflux transporter [Candidatus Gallacutalibacter pullicola]|uniref:Probable multidrug resistance protein NorM n=1 Tax=Candidatus Gallacutalibacter pullicola TaxID=2840830 RepID=A0A9D1DR94_9FIRM|nr:MATE family efflux transporter [Candidatus Gallacutalibacter pullicola]
MKLWGSLKETFRNRELMGTIFHLAWPTIVEQALQTVVSYADTAQVGAIGANASASVGLTTSVMWLVNAPMFAIGMGFLSVISRALGADDRQTARRAAMQAIWMTVVLGLVEGVIAVAVSPVLPVWLGAEQEIQRDAAIYFGIVSLPMLFRCSTIILASVLRATKNTRTPMIFNTIMNVINITLNAILIGPAGLGVAGAAIATAIGYAVGGTLMFVSVLRSPVLDLRTMPVRLDWAILKRCLSIGLPIAGERITACLGQVLFTALIARLGTVSVAAHSIGITAEQAFYIPGYGMQTAAATLCGFSAGEKDEKKLMQYSSAICVMAVVLMGSLSTLMFFIPELILGIFTRDAAVIALGTQLLKIVAFSEPFFAAAIIMEGVFNGVGDTKAPFVISLMTMWGIRILFTFLVVNVFHLGLASVWLCMVGDNVTRCILLVFRYFRGSWKRRLDLEPAKA